jgi:RHS repeat-associated protein
MIVRRVAIRREKPTVLKAASAAMGLAVVLIVLGVACWSPALASAAECTDNWEGPAGGSWAVSGNWSTGKVPSSSDVACMAGGTSVAVTSEELVGAIQSEGALEVGGGAVLVLGGPSSVRSLKETGGLLAAGEPGLHITTSFEWEQGNVSGTVVVDKSAEGSIGHTGLFGRLVNRGHLSLFWMYVYEGAEILNEGVLTVNGEPPGAAIEKFSSTVKSKIVNKGTLQKNAATGPGAATEIQSAIENSGTVRAAAGLLQFDEGSPASTGIWEGVEGGTVVLNENSAGGFHLTSGVLKGKLEVRNGSGGAVEFGEMETENVTLLTNGAVVVRGAVSVDKLKVTGGVIEGAGPLHVTTSFEWEQGDISGTLVVEEGAEGSIGHTGLFGRLVNRGHLSIYWMYVYEGSEILNEGVLSVNGESLGAAIEKFTSTVKSKIVNHGTIQKTAASRLEGTSEIQSAIENFGTVRAAAGVLEFSGGSPVSTGTWEGKGGGKLFFGGGEATKFSLPSGTLKGQILIRGSLTVDLGTVNAENAEISVISALLDVGGTVPVESLEDTAGVLGGAGTLQVTRSFGWEEGGISAPTTLVLMPGAIGTSGGRYDRLFGRLVDRGRFDIPFGSIEMFERGELINDDTMTVNSEFGEHAIHKASAGPEQQAKLVNDGSLLKTGGSGTSVIDVPFENFGTYEEASGRFEFTELAKGLVSEANPEHCKTYDPVDCATGNFTEEQTDFSIGGRGLGLDLERTYSTYAAVSGVVGIFGSGWSNSLSEHLTAESEGAHETLTEASGETVPFIRIGGSWVAPSWSQDALVGSAEAGFVLKLPGRVVEKFTGSGQLESAADANGNETKLGYDASGRLTTITDPSGRQISLTYNGAGFVEKAEDPMGHVVEYGYESGNLKTVTFLGEVSPKWSFGYNGSHEMTSVTDGRGGMTTNEFDGSHRVISQTDPAGRVTTFEYGPFHTRITNEATGAVTDEWFNSDNQPISVTKGFGTPVATTTSFTYSAAGLLASRTDGAGNTWSYEYDESGDRTGETNPLGAKTSWTFNGVHEVLTETTPNGEKTTIARNSHGNPESISRLGPGSETQVFGYKYGPRGEVKSFTDAIGNEWDFGYDAYGDLEAEVDPSGDRRTWEYDADSFPIVSVSPRGNAPGGEAAAFTTFIERDSLGRPVAILEPLGAKTEITYNAEGAISSAVGPEGSETKFSYNADGEPTAVETPGGATEEFRYDGAGKVIGRTNADGDETTYVRNVLEQPVESVDALGRVTKESYDPAGDLMSEEDPEGKKTSYVYSEAEQLAEVRYSDGITPDVRFAYDKDGHLTSMVDGTGESIYEYDRLGRLVHAEDGDGQTMSWEYSLDDEPIGVIYPNGKSVSRAYDDSGRLESVTDWLGNTTSFGYDPDSSLVSTTFPAGTSNRDEYSVDHADHVTGVTMKKGAETLASLNYARNPSGQVESLISAGLPGAETEAFKYDQEGRLVEAGGEAYEYDATGNPVGEAGSVNVFDEAGELVSSAGQTFKYDKEGNRIEATNSAGPVAHFRFNEAGNLISVDRAEGSGASAIDEALTYDGVGRLASRIAGSATSHFVWDPTSSSELLLSDGEDSFIYGPDGLPVEQVSSSEVPTYLHHDQQGSTRLLTNGAGESVGKFTYGPYGQLTAQIGTASSPLGYAGQYTFGESGLQDLRARVYDPSTAQFLSVDPDDAATGQPYAYADDDPLGFDDPSGALGIPTVGSVCEDPEVAAGCILIGGGGAVGIGLLEGHGLKESVLNAADLGEPDDSEEVREQEALDEVNERYEESIREEEEDACQIAEGHAFKKHGKEFGVESPDELAKIVKETMDKAKVQDGGVKTVEEKTFYYDEDTNTAVVRNPKDPDRGTVFKPDLEKGFMDTAR